VEHNFHGWMSLEKLKERQVCLPVCILQHMIKVSYGLMIMNGEDEMEFLATFQKEFLLPEYRFKFLRGNYNIPAGFIPKGWRYPKSSDRIWQTSL